MDLYHFTSSHLLKGIKSDGITKGRTPYIEDGVIKFHDHHQWLTTESNPFKQSWDGQVLLNYSRTDYRLHINIPKSHLHNLKTMDEILEMLGDTVLPDFDIPDKTDAWRCYLGDIPRAWILRTRKMHG